VSSTAQTAPASDIEAGLALYRQMLLIRAFEDTVQSLFQRGEVHGTTHLYSGQEAVAVGVSSVLGPDDRVAATYRGHGHALALGVEPQGLLDEMLGRATGVCAGRSGSMNVIDLEHRLLGCYGIIGGSIAAATGASLGLRRRGGVAVAYFGDGTTNHGYFFECLNFAKVFSLPVVYVCENNLYGEFTPWEQVTAGKIEKRPEAFGIPQATIDGNDVWAVQEAAGAAVERARAGEGPQFIQAMTYRLVGHSRSDPGKYRKPGELDAWRERDPLKLARATLSERFEAEASVLDELEAEVAEQLVQMTEAALAAPYPEPGGGREFKDTATPSRAVVSPVAKRLAQSAGVDPATVAGSGPRGRIVKRDVEAAIANGSEAAEPPATLEFRQAIRDALDEELARDDSVIFFGEDVAAPGGVFATTGGLQEAHGPDRVFDTPISELAITGTAYGSAITGLRPVIEIMFGDFLFLAMDSLVNQSAKFFYLSNEQGSVPLVVRSAVGAGGRFGAIHSQNPISWFQNIPGLKIVAPSSPHDAKSLLKAAIRDDNPVLFLEHKRLYAVKAPYTAEAEEVARLGEARVVREGADVTLVSAMKSVGDCLDAAAALAEHGIDAEVIDLRTLRPLDGPAILRSLAKTNRLAVVEEGPISGGWGAEILAIAAEQGLGDVDDVWRIATANHPIPYSPPLEDDFLPGVEAIVQSVRSHLGT
jgi:pyruvate/2-oxoglutarate/acetoin dehydrogenase E1 component/TPP-dependent pyruvate/acetoin dehydrogenase alpha subunit